QWRPGTSAALSPPLAREGRCSGPRSLEPPPTNPIIQLEMLATAPANSPPLNSPPLNSLSNAMKVINRTLSLVLLALTPALAGVVRAQTTHPCTPNGSGTLEFFIKEVLADATVRVFDLDGNPLEQFPGDY